MKHYITNYAGEIVGNPKGYNTNKGACMALNCRYKNHSKLRYYLWEAYDKAKEQGYTGNLVYSIKLAD